MQVIKDKQIIEDNWRFVTDDAAEVSSSNIIVSLARWQKDKQQLLKSNSKLGVRISPADSVADLAADLKDCNSSSWIFLRLLTAACFLMHGCLDTVITFRRNKSNGALHVRSGYSFVAGRCGRIQA